MPPRRIPQAPSPRGSQSATPSPAASHPASLSPGTPAPALSLPSPPAPQAVRAPPVPLTPDQKAYLEEHAFHSYDAASNDADRRVIAVKTANEMFTHFNITNAEQRSQLRKVRCLFFPKHSPMLTRPYPSPFITFYTIVLCGPKVISNLNVMAS